MTSAAGNAWFPPEEKRKQDEEESHGAVWSSGSFVMGTGRRNVGGV